MGDFQGRRWEDRGEIVNKRKEDIMEPESPQSVKERAVKWWNETIVGTGTNAAAWYVLIVSHSAWIRMLVKGLLEDGSVHAGFRVRVGRCLNTGVSIISISRRAGSQRGRGKLLQYGNIEHLGLASRATLHDLAEEIGEENRTASQGRIYQPSEKDSELGAEP